MHLTLSIALVVGLVASSAPAQEIALPADYDPTLYTNPEAVDRGRALYDANCASCHGARLEGQEDWRAPSPVTGRRPAPPHSAEGHTWHHSDLQNWAVTKFGLAALVGNGYESDMLAFGDVLSDAEILDILAYIKSTWPDEIIRQHDAMMAGR